MNIPLNHVRLSYPQLFKAKSFSAPRPGETPSEPKFSASAILDKVKHAALIEAIRAGMKAVAEEKWGVGKVPKTVKYCLRDGSEKEDTDGYGEDIMPVGWKLLTTIIALSGMFAFAWTTSVLLNMMKMYQEARVARRTSKEKIR